MKKMRKNKVFVGLSGGVDSSVSAALLKRAGYDVTGVFIKVWHPDFFVCDWKDDRRDAMRVCARLNIPFITLDLEKEYRREVVDYMITEYKAGRTPNPDVMCNKEIKFGALLGFAKKRGADFIATGHYAVNTLKVKTYHLEASRDTNKDQTYFLWTLTQEQLKHILFPVGDKTKPEVRRLARKFNLATAEKKDSQGLCFIGKIDMKEFLSQYLKPKRGNVLDVAGRKIGHHEGAVFLTIGQRHGFTVMNKKTASKAMYVVGKNVKKNTVTVSELKPGDVQQFGIKTLELRGVNWIAKPLDRHITYGVRLRYRQKLLTAHIERKDKTWLTHLDKQVSDAASGQSVVVYREGECLGGGIIQKTIGWKH